MKTRFAARLAVATAEREYSEAIFAELPPGSLASYDNGRGALIEVKVIGHSQERVCVRNPETGKEYWLYENRLEPVEVQLREQLAPCA